MTYDLMEIQRLVHSDEPLDQAQRLFHGRGHAYPGLEHITIDWLPPVLLITLFSEQPAKIIENLAEKLLAKFPSCKSVQVQYRYVASGPVYIIYGEKIHDLIVKENMLKFCLRLGKNKNCGLFLDMRNGRSWVMKNSQYKRVLNLFSYTCGFSVAAIAGDAQSVVNVDMSSSALKTGRENHRINQQDLRKVRFEKLDIFKSFGRLKKRGPFDLLICDPPTFQQGSVDIKRDYAKILRRLDDFMGKDSQIMLCLNAPELNRNFLLENMATHAPDYQLIEDVYPPRVFKEAEGKGLKVLCFNRKSLS